MSFVSDYEAAASGSLSLSRQQFEDVSALARGLVALADLISELGGVEVPREIEALRSRAAMESRADQVERVKTDMAQSKLAAMRAPKAPRRHYVKQGPNQAPDPTGAALERQRLLATHGSQAARHAALAKAGPHPGDGSDAHRATRAIREKLYADMAGED